MNSNELKVTLEKHAEAWELPREEWVDQKIRASRYADSYLSDPNRYDQRADQLRDRWKEQVEARGEEARIPTATLDDYAAKYGDAAIGRAFRGAREKGAEGYEPPEIRIWDKSYQQVLRMNARGELGHGNTNIRKMHRDAIQRAMDQGESVPDKGNEPNIRSIAPCFF